MGTRPQTIDFKGAELPEAFQWLNPPLDCQLGNGLQVRTRKETDFWQRTHYGFCRDDGHCLLASLAGDFSFATRVEFHPVNKYDQCGLMLRIDGQNWIKVSTEYEDQEHSRLGSVVTNLGYSDWATQDVSSAIREMWYRASRRGSDFLLEHSPDGGIWHQMRIAHLHKADGPMLAGVYACSPMGENFRCRFKHIEVGESTWR